MAIRMMVSETEAGKPGVERVDDYPGHEAGLVRHHETCPHHAKRDLSGARSPECPVESGQGAYGPYRWERCDVFGPLYMQTTHAGLVLELRERNGYDDSDFYATVWNPATGKPESIEYASTRGWTYPNGAAVDATPEVLAAYAAYQDKVAAEYAARRAAQEAATPRVGKTVKVVKGRKIPIGTVAEVFWAGKSDYARGPRYSPMARAYGLVPAGAEITRVGLRLADGSRVFTDRGNVEVVQNSVANATK